MKRTQQQFIVDILDAMSHAETFIKGVSLDELQQDVRTQWALERAFAIIGEAAKKVDPELKGRYPELPWRDLLVHGYWMVQLEIIVDTIRIDFPKHKPIFEQILRDLESEEDQTNPDLHLQEIVEFLGYVPFERGETLGQRITIHRKTLGLSHYQFAKKLGVAPCTIMNWEHDRVKNVETKIRPYLDGLVEFD